MSDPLKVLYCSYDVIPEPTGSSTRGADTLRALASAFTVDGLTVKTADHSHIERFHGVRLMRVPVGAGDLPVRVQAFERAVRRQLESDEYPLVHFTDPFGGYPLCELKAQLGYKAVYEVLGLPSVEVKLTHPHLEGDRRFMAKLRRQELYCLMNADVVVVGSEVTARHVQSMGVARDRIARVPTGADAALYAAQPLPAPDRTPMRVLYLGGQQPWQGLSTLIDAVALAAGSCELHVTLRGPQNPGWRLQLEEQIKRLGLTSVVELADAVSPEQLPAQLGAADLAVLPLAEGERNGTQGAPLAKLAHYLMAGRPVLASDLPVVREVADPSCTVFHAAGDARDLARRLIDLSRDPVLRATLGRAAQAWARQRLSGARARESLLRVYRVRLLGLPPEEPGADLETPVPADQPTSIANLEDSSTDRVAKKDDELTQLTQSIRTDGPTDPLQPTQSPVMREAAPAPKAPASEEPVECSPEEVEEITPGSPPLPVARAAEGAGRQAPSKDLPPGMPPPLPKLAADNRPDGATPASGTSPAEEWLGHVLFGYAPFDVPLTR